MNRKTANLLIVLILVISITLMAYTITRAHAEGMAPTIWTDKPDYSPEETVIIAGSGFLPNTQIAGTVIRPTLPDPTTDTWTNTSDSLGNFTYAYQLDGVTGTYNVTATDGTNTAAPITFTDASVTGIYACGSTYPPAKSSFWTFEDVLTYLTVSGGQTKQVDIYVVSGLPPPNQVMTDVSGGAETVTISAPSFGPSLVWAHPTTAGDYYIVADENHNGKYNSGENTYAFSIIADTAPPVVTISSPTAGQILSSGTISVTGTSSDTGGSGVAKVEVRVDVGSWILATGTTSWSYTTGSLDEGSHTLCARATDNAGNQATTSVTITVDTIAPVTTDNYDGLWHKADFTVTLTAADATSGVANTYYKINGGATKTVGVDGQPKITTESATNTLEYWSVDVAANLEVHHTLNNIKLDKTAPTITGAPDRAPNGNGWYKADVTVTFTVSDALSGVDSSTAPVTLGEGKDQSVPGTVTDKAGNKASTTVSGINIDETSPSVTLSADRAADKNGWYNHKVAFSVDATDALSGVDTALTVTPADYSGPDSSSITVTGSATDFAGNTASDSVTFKYDATPPTLSKNLSGIAGLNGWYTSNVMVTLTGGDTGGSGLASVEYSLNSGGWTTYTAPFSISAEGENTLEHRATDNAGNVYVKPSQTIKIDKTAPSITVSFVDCGVYPEGTPLTFAAVDYLSGIDTIVGTLTTDSGPVPVVSGTQLSAGVYTLLVQATDKAGNTATIGPIMFVIYDPNGGFVTGGGWINSPTGAYTADPTLTGKATFGFVSKYEKGATVPTGNTEFIFHVAGMNFKSTDYDWLVVAGSKAQYKGTGTINGVGNYGFMLTAIDGGTRGVDQFRIKIWDKTTGNVIYDNKMTLPDTTSDPLTTILGGSIVIHK